MKIGQYVREKLIPLLEKFDQDDFKLLLENVSTGKTKDTFGLHNTSEKIPFLIKGTELAEKLRRCYYAKNPIKRQNGEVYYLTSQWYDDQFSKVEQWLSGYATKYGLEKDIASIKNLSEYLQWLKEENETNRDDPESLENFLANIVQCTTEKTWIRKYLGENKKSCRSFFRGHSKRDYKLLSSIRRQDDYPEDVLFKNFESRFYGELQGKSIFEKLAIMQHHEYFSRLLDITENPLVAIYFACKNHCEEGDDNAGIVYKFTSEISDVLYENDGEIKFLSALAVLKQDDKNKLFNLVTSGARKTLSFIFSSLNKSERKQINAILKSAGVTIRDDFNLCRILYPRIVQPNSSLERIKRQSGLFVMDPLSGTHSNQNPSIPEFQMVFNRVEIPSTCKKDILKELDSLCINEFALFQNMDSFSKSTKMRG